MEDLQFESPSPSTSSLYVLDTCVGWNPEGVLSIFLFLKFLTRNPNSKGAIITNCEINDKKGLQQQRAHVVQLVLDAYFTDFPSVVPLFSGIEEPHKIPHSRMLDICAGVFDRITESLGTEPPNVFDNITDFQGYVRLQQDKKVEIVWINIGGMTNLQYILMRDIVPSRIIQMAGACDHPETNIRFHPDACRKVINICGERTIPLTFVTMDTVATPRLRWIVRGVVQEPWTSILAESNQEVLKIIQLGIGAYSSEYSEDSLLYAPLTLMYALEDKARYFPTVNAQIDCKKNGHWFVGIDVVDLYKEGGLLCGDREPSNSARRDWWKSKGSCFKGINELETSIQISFGPLNETEIDTYFRGLEYLLVDNELEKEVRMTRKLAEEERQRRLEIERRSNAIRECAKHKIASDVERAGKRAMDDYIKAETKKKTELAIEEERRRKEQYEIELRARFEREATLAKAAAEKEIEEAAERARIAKAKAKRLHQFD